MSVIFEKAFARTLKEDVTGLGPEVEADAFTQSLDDGTNPDAFDVNSPEGPDAEAVMGANKEMARISSEASAKMHTDLTGWIIKLEEFADFLNGVDSKSIQMSLKNAIPDTVFDKMKTSETKKIARVAMEIASLSEQFKGYLAAADDPKFKFE